MVTHAASTDSRQRSVNRALEQFATKAEARDAAVALARAYTGRETAISMAGPYTREALALLSKTMAEAPERIAALVIELDAGGNTVVYGRFVRKARELASAEGALLIWCETAADPDAFRGGLQKTYRIKADLSCFTFDGPSPSTWLCVKEEALGDEVPV
jgi:glutamate-1-semialdehyde aminotransferase